MCVKKKMYNKTRVINKINNNTSYDRRTGVV